MALTTLVLLPGLDGTGLLFAPLLAALPHAIQPIVMRNPTDRVMGYASLTDLVAEQLPMDNPFVLLDESFGGPLAILLAARRPPGLAGLVLCATFATSPRPWVGPLLRPLVGPRLFHLYPAFKRTRARTNRHAAPGSWAAAAEVSRLVRPDVIAARVRMVLSVDVREPLRACPVPILYLRATRDHVVPASNLRRIQRVRPDVSAVPIPSSHQVLQQRPVECAAAIDAFIKRLDVVPAGRTEAVN